MVGTLVLVSMRTSREEIQAYVFDGTVLLMVLFCINFDFDFLF